MAKFSTLEQRLGIQFKDRSLLSRALTHRSYLNENPTKSLEDNERLEFLGDAVLDFLVGAYLYHRFPEVDEGELTSFRAALVRGKTLAQFARQLELDKFVRLGLGEAKNGGRERIPILCATFEAVIGAMYLDQGLDVVKPLVETLSAPALKEIMAESLHRDAKSDFQMWAQGKYNITPRYLVIGSSGPDHAKMFRTQVLVGDDVWGEGEGRSKQFAAQSAATVALEKVADL